MPKLYPIGKHLKVSPDCQSSSWYTNKVFQVTKHVYHRDEMMYQIDTFFYPENLSPMNIIKPNYTISDDECLKLDRLYKLKKLKIIAE
jgi:hypothetical protein